MILASLLLSFSSAYSAECTGDLRIVLVDPLAYKRANDEILDTIMLTGDVVSWVPGGKDLAGVLTFPLTIGSTSDAWRDAKRGILTWMGDNGVHGSISMVSPGRAAGWMLFDAEEGTLASSPLVEASNPVAFWENQDMAINVHIDDPRQAAKAVTGRGLGWFPKTPRLKAHTAILEAIAPWMKAKHMNAFAHLGAGFCDAYSG